MTDNEKRAEAHRLLASIADTINSWCREESYPECHEYLTYALRDHIIELWGSLNLKHNRIRVQRDYLLSIAKEILPCIGRWDKEGDLVDLRYELEAAVKEVEG